MKVVSTVAIAIAVAMFASMWSHGAPRATAANILTNPTFDTDISGWSISFGATIAHSAATGNPPGSASIATTTVGNSAQSIGQCVPATAGETYDISAQVLLPTANQPAGTVAFMTRNFNFTADCTGGAVPGGGGQSSDITPSDTWQTMSFGSLVAPPSTQGLLLVLFVFGSDPVGTDQTHAFFDNANVDWQGGPTATPTSSSTATTTNTPSASTSTPSPTNTSSVATATRTPTPLSATTGTPPSGTTTPVAPAATSTQPGGGSGAGVIGPPDTGQGYSNRVEKSGLTAGVAIAVSLAASGVLALREGARRRS